jgi:hypothetical protein
MNVCSLIGGFLTGAAQRADARGTMGSSLRLSLPYATTCNDQSGLSSDPHGARVDGRWGSAAHLASAFRDRREAGFPRFSEVVGLGQAIALGEFAGGPGADEP